MKALLRSARIAPKKANIIARMVRGMCVPEAQDLLSRTHKKAARLFEDLLASAVANAAHNDRQNPQVLVVKEVVVNQGSAYKRGVPMARGRVRPMQKFLSHISLVLGVQEVGGENKSAQLMQKKQRKQKSKKKGEEEQASTPPLPDSSLSF